MPKSFERCHQILKLVSLYILQSNSSVSVFIMLSFVNRSHYQLKCVFSKLKEMPVKCVKYTLLNPFNICSDILLPNINQNSSQKRLKTKHHPVMLPKHWPAHFSITFWLKQVISFPLTARPMHSASPGLQDRKSLNSCGG